MLLTHKGPVPILPSQKSNPSLHHPHEEEMTMRTASLPIALIVFGIAWLLWYFRMFPDIDWIIAAGMAVAGIAILAIDRITKTSVVTGPFLIAAGVAWFVHDKYRYTWLVLIPVLLIFLGLMMLIARFPQIPARPEKKSLAKPINNP